MINPNLEWLDYNDDSMRTAQKMNLNMKKILNKINRDIGNGYNMNSTVVEEIVKDDVIPGIMERIYPIGIIIGLNTDSTPETLNMPGHWIQVLQDSFPVGAGATYNVGEEGGNAQIVLESDQLPHHTHTYMKSSDKTEDAESSTATTAPKNEVSTSSSAKQHKHTIKLEETETKAQVYKQESIDNRPPFYAINFWQRIT